MTDMPVQSDKQLTEHEAALRDLNESYTQKYGFHEKENYAFKSQKGLNADIVRTISEMKNEPGWMTDFRLKAYEEFVRRPMPQWGGGGLLDTIDFDDIYYFVRAMDEQGRSWEEIPEEIKRTFDRLGIPEAEQKFLQGVTAQYESEVVYHSIRKDLEEKGVYFTDMDSGLREYSEIVRQHFGSIIPYTDNKFAALNSAVWSGGSFVYVPKGVHIEMPLQAYFRINTQNMGQFERTLIIVEEGAYVHYVEGCTAPTYSSNSLHSAVVEILVKEGGRCRYTTIQNWSPNVFNLVTKRAVAQKRATMEWVDANLGCLAEGSTVTTPEGIKAIEALEVGDQVLSYDETNCALVFRTVLAKKFSGNQSVHTVSVGERKLNVTANHPFYTRVYEIAGLSDYRLGYVRADRIVEAVVPRLESVSVELPASFNRSNAVGQSNVMADMETVILNDVLEVVNVDVSEPTAQTVPTWDIEVEGTGNFVSQGFIVHNSKLTMKYPAVILEGEGAHGEVLSIAFAGAGQHQDAGAKITHLAPNTTSQILSKSISKDGGRASYRGLLKIVEGADNVKSNVVCDALLLDDGSRSDTYPTIEVDAQNVTMGHEASVSRVGEDQLFYAMSRGMTEDEANAMIVNGFIEPLVKELPMEYALEMNRLIQIQLEGSIG
jgi:Fe-S cluster assembly scaffold protein SufB